MLSSAWYNGATRVDRADERKNKFMNSKKHLQRTSIITGLAAALALSSFTPSARANVYASNIKINGSLTTATAAQGGSANISYILNEAADSGVTIKILSGATVVRTITVAGGGAGALKGVNTVAWDGKNDSNANVSPGTYSVSITAASAGHPGWTQISNDADPGQFAYYPFGIDVDKNTNSPYYGRVVMSCTTKGSGIPPQADGLYKMNADGSVADEGWYGYAGYTTDDFNQTDTGQMPKSNGSISYHQNPTIIRIGEDDRIYWCDGSAVGSIISCDILATSYQIVITSGTYVSAPEVSHWGGPYNYQNNPQVGDLDQAGVGIRQFDVCGLGTTNAAVYLVDRGDFPSWGVWAYHLTNGVPGTTGAVSDPNDTVGVRCILTGDGTTFVTSAGIMVDYSNDVFVSESRSNPGDVLYRTACFTNWNGGAVPPEGTSEGNEANAVGVLPAWKVGSANDNMRGIYDTVIDSRVHPTLVAQAMSDISASYGIRLLSAADGSTVVDNLDPANGYNSAAFDNVGNVYGCSRFANRWRVWSPPGANQATTAAVPTVAVVVRPVITSISVSGGIVTIHFTAGSSDVASAFTLVSSSTVNGAYTPAAGASITGTGPSFTATVPASGPVQFYRIRR